MSKQHKPSKLVADKESVYMRLLHQDMAVPIREICRRFPQYSQRTIYRHAKGKVPLKSADGRKLNRGRPRKLTLRDERKIKRALLKLRNETGNFSSLRIQEETQLTHISSRTFRRHLNKLGFKYLQSRKKGLLTNADKKKRLSYARKFINSDIDFWRHGIAFYFDGVGFAHKYNPFAEARAVGSMQWRKPNEGLGRSTKGRKEGSGGRMANFFVAIAYGRGVVLCKNYPWNVTGERFARFVKHCFPGAFEKCGKTPVDQLFLQDGDPKQTSKVAEEAWKELGCQMFSIPARSPDLNPIENIFHLVRQELANDALVQEIYKENYEDFCKRVANTISNFSVEVIDRTIDSMKDRLRRVIQTKGERTKY